jgi:hypothetical protein
VEKREMEIPMEIQKQAVDLDEEVFGVAAPAVGWQRLQLIQGCADLQIFLVLGGGGSCTARARAQPPPPPL